MSASKALSQALSKSGWRPRYQALKKIATAHGKKGWKGLGNEADAVFGLVEKAARTDASFWVRGEAIRVLGVMGTRGVKRVIAAVSKERRSEVRHIACRALAAMSRHRQGAFMGGQDAAAIRALTAALKDHAIRLTAGQAIEQITGNPLPMLYTMIKILNHRSGMVRGMIALSFARISPRAKLYAPGLLIEAIAQSKASLHHNMITALVVMGQASVGPLNKALKHRKATVRKAAKAALARLKKKR